MRNFVGGNIIIYPFVSVLETHFFPIELRSAKGFFMSKKCSKCNTEKPETSFNKESGTSDGLDTQCRDCKNAYFRRYRTSEKFNSIKSKEQRRLSKKRWQEKNKIKPEFRIAKNLRMRVNHALNGRAKEQSTFSLVGCGIEELKNYISSKFTNGMSWENYGKWHIDHIKPCAAFDLTDPKQQVECFHYKNLQPLWAKDNLSKGDMWQR